MPKKYYKSKHKLADMQESNLHYNAYWTRQNWKCNSCGEFYFEETPYCLPCYQELYYFSYINNQFFVIKDDSYLELYANPNNQHHDSQLTEKAQFPYREDWKMTSNEDQTSSE